MSSALAIDHDRPLDLPSEFRRPEPKKRQETKSPLPPEWSDATKPFRGLAEQLRELFSGR